MTIQSGFTAEHSITLPSGEKEASHRHDWLVRVSVSSADLNPMGLVMDFHRLESMLGRVLESLRGHNLDTLPPFSGKNTTAEVVVRHIYDALEPLLPGGVRLESAEIREAPDCWAKYTPGR